MIACVICGGFIPKDLPDVAYICGDCSIESLVARVDAAEEELAKTREALAEIRHREWAAAEDYLITLEYREDHPMAVKPYRDLREWANARAAEAIAEEGLPSRRRASSLKWVKP